MGLVLVGTQIFNASININEDLWKAAQHGNVGQVNELLSKGADVNFIFNKYAMTPLYAAASSGHKEIVEILLAAGANVNVVNKSGESPLHKAVEGGKIENKELLKILLAAGANVNAPDKKGKTPLYRTVESWDANKELLKILLAAGANVNAPDLSGATPLHIAVRNKRASIQDILEIVRILLAAGANPWIKDAGGRMPSEMGYLPEVRELINEKMELGASLQNAARQGRKDLMEFYIAKGALLNLPDEEGNIPLHLAIMSKNIDAVKYLLQFAKLINFRLKNNQGQTVIDLARDFGSVDVLEAINQATNKAFQQQESAPQVFPPSPVSLEQTRREERLRENLEIINRINSFPANASPRTILNLPANTAIGSPAVLKAKHELLIRVHPDKNPSHRDVAGQATRRVMDAARTLNR